MNKFLILLLNALFVLRLAANPSLVIDVGHPSGRVSPRLYGLMTEEINHSYDGGLYAELINNRAFLDNTEAPAHWSVLNDDSSASSIALDKATPFNDKLTISLRLTVEKAAREHPAGVANSGYWGIPVNPNTRYRATLLARSDAGLSGPLTVSIVGEDGKLVYASGKISGLSSKWNRFEVTLKTGHLVPTTKARFCITLDQPGTV